jgi:methionine-rich copper-binding protein CopC
MKTIRFLIVLAMLVGSLTARAHSMLHASVPADGAQLPTAPAALELDFGSEVRLVALRVSGADGAPVDVQPPSAGEPARRFTLPMPALSPQHYTVEWTVMGADTHRVSGKFGFEVGKAAQ